MNWIQYEPEGDDYIPIEQWGRDHWSTLAYAETQAVDGNGALDNRKMRCDARLHRQFATEYHVQTTGRKCPTRLRDGTEAERHDDWSCLEDAAAAGLVRLEWHENAHRASRGMVFGNCKARVAFTSTGLEIAAQLRQHRATGGTNASFIPTTT